jgi:hypothetical protein
MGGDPFKHLLTGDDFEVYGESYNAALDAGKALRAGGTGFGVPPLAPRRDSNIVRIRNDSGSAVERFGILGIEGSVFDPGNDLDAFRGAKVLTGDVPATDSHAGKFVVTLEPIADGDVGLAMAAGVTQVKMNVTVETAIYADVEDGNPDALATATSGGATILWKESGTGEKWAVVRIDSTMPGSRLPVQLQYKELINDTPDTSFVPGQFTAQNNGSFAWRDDSTKVGDPAAAGFTILEEMQDDFLDPAIQINTAGRWSIYWQWWLQIVWNYSWLPLEDHLLETRQTDSTDGHYHDFDAWNLQTTGLCAQARIQERPLGGSWGPVSGATMYTVVLATDGTWLSNAYYQGQAQAIVDLGVGTDLRMSTYMQSYFASTEGAKVVGAYLILERVA